jgi:hypothetical protein
LDPVAIVEPMVGVMTIATALLWVTPRVMLIVVVK